MIKYMLISLKLYFELTMKYVFEGKFTLVFVFSLRKRRRMYALVNAIRTSILIAFATSSETGPSERWRIRVPPTLTSEHTKSQTLEELSSDDDYKKRK